jgi:hypothetical protein
VFARKKRKKKEKRKKKSTKSKKERVAVTGGKRSVGLALQVRVLVCYWNVLVYCLVCALAFVCGFCL